jgi:predicted RNase H-like HicB family nuclease
MILRLQLEYWKGGPWFVGRFPQVRGVFSQGATLDEPEKNIRDAYRISVPVHGNRPLKTGLQSHLMKLADVPQK